MWEMWTLVEKYIAVSHKNSQLICDKRLKTIEWNKHSLFNKWYWNNWVYTCKKKKKRNLCTKLKWSEITQLCPTLCDPMDCSLPGSSVHGILQARILEWVAIALSPSQKFTDLNVKHKTIKFLEDNIGENLDDLSDTF